MSLCGMRIQARKQDSGIEAMEEPIDDLTKRYDHLSRRERDACARYPNAAQILVQSNRFYDIMGRQDIAHAKTGGTRLLQSSTL